MINSRAQVPFSDLLPEFRVELLGKSVGAIIETKENPQEGEEQKVAGTFEVVAIYKVFPPKEDEAQAEDPERGETHADQTVVEGQ